MQQSSPTILIVDDTPENAKLLFDFLSNYDFEVSVAQSGEKALQLLEYELPGLILLDIMMPGLDGFETCARLKANPRTQDIPIIFMTALSEPMNKVKGFKLGAVDYVTKPFHQEEVLARINTHLTLRNLQQKLQIQNAELHSKNTELESEHNLVLQLNAQLQHEIYERQRAEMALLKANTELQRLATIDGLTQVANRRRFDEYLSQEWGRTLREKSTLALILCDIDYFKDYNDTYGHQAGDDCLRQIALAISRSVRRPTDLVARYGGEEFAVILPNTPPVGALHVAENIQNSLQYLEITHGNSMVNQYVTLSIGIATNLQTTSVEVLIRMADDALYEAKKQGRNRIVLKDGKLA